MIPTPIVITSINPPNEAIKKFARIKGFRLFIAGDLKTPNGWKHPNAEYLSIPDQNKKYAKFSTLIPKNHYARKNIAYVDAIRTDPLHLYETDDDNLPYTVFPNFLSDSAQSIVTVTAPPAFNIYSLFTNDPVWPRGLPLPSIKEKLISKRVTQIRPLVQQSLADLDPDVDAIYRLTNGKVIRFAKNKTFALERFTFCPFNSQNTYWQKQAFPLLYLPSTVDSRVTDIWRGYIAQRILWEMGSRLVFLSAGVYQKRNIHDFHKDFRQELDLYLRAGELVDALKNIRLKGTLSKMLMTVYEHLVRQQFFKKEELSIVSEWLRYVA